MGGGGSGKRGRARTPLAPALSPRLACFFARRSLQCWRIFGERTLVTSVFAKCVAAISDSQSRGSLGREINFYQGGGR